VAKPSCSILNTCDAKSGSRQKSRSARGDSSLRKYLDNRGNILTIAACIKNFAARGQKNGPLAWVGLQPDMSA